MFEFSEFFSRYSLKWSPSKSPVNVIQVSSLIQPNSMTPPSRLQSSRNLDMMGSIPPPLLPPTVPPTASPPVQPPAVGQTMTAKVVHISSPSHFYVQQLNTDLLSQLSRLKTVKVKTFNNIQPGAACLARFNGDEGYHRVVVISVISRKVKVFYVDYGNFSEVPLDEIYPLTPELRREPALAVPCSLTREIPQHMLPMFSEMVVDKTLSVTIKVK